MKRKRNNRRRLALTLLVLALGCGPATGPPREARIIRVIGGDRAVLAGGVRVRLVGIDAPKSAQNGRPGEFPASRARDYLTELIQGKTVRLEYDRERYDRSGRLLAYLFLPDGTLVNAALVRQGLARVHIHPPNVRFREELLAAQQEAMAAGRGLWAH
jgi:micrococcal nuclease